jgi:hypothetical protein
MPIALSSSGLKNLFQLLTNGKRSTVKRPATTLQYFASTFRSLWAPAGGATFPDRMSSARTARP